MCVHVHYIIWQIYFLPVKCSVVCVIKLNLSVFHSFLQKVLLFDGDSLKECEHCCIVSSWFSVAPE